MKTDKLTPQIIHAWLEAKRKELGLRAISIAAVDYQPRGEMIAHGKTCEFFKADQMDDLEDWASLEPSKELEAAS